MTVKHYLFKIERLSFLIVSRCDLIEYDLIEYDLIEYDLIEYDLIE